ncbi:MAG: UbiA prenyltransferase family protein [Candidatus Thermoplasmatota archaeon]|nr:UbiA prenyltransferase family protein [Candidatus Thermoplasmatota archaeon]
MLEKIRSFADIGRTQGVTTSASVVIVGALTSTVPVEWYYIIYFTILTIFAHMVLNTYIALGDVELDAHTYVPSRNPVISGLLSKKEAMRFFYAGTLICLLMIVLLLVKVDPFFVLLCFFCSIPAFGSLVWYGWKGKKFLVSYDFAFSISYSFFVLFGVFAVGGYPTIFTWIFIGVVIFAATAFAQWENGLKDVDADRSVGVKSFAVVTGVRNNKRLSATHPFYLYGWVLKIGFLLCCFLAYWVTKNIYYLLFLVFFGIPSQCYIMYRFLVKQTPQDHRRTILFDVTFAAILAYSTIFGYTGVVPIVLLIIYLIGGYLVGSLIQSNCEFKFRRFSASFK